MDMKNTKCRELPRHCNTDDNEKHQQLKILEQKLFEIWKLFQQEKNIRFLRHWINIFLDVYVLSAIF